MKLLLVSSLLLFLTVSALPWHKKIPIEATRPVCEARNVNANFDQSNITFALVVQNSRDLISALLDMKNVASRVVADLDTNHKGWIGLYSFWQFNNEQFYFDTNSPNASILSKQIDIWIDRNRQAKYICKHLLVFETIYSILSSNTATKNMQIFIYLSGGIKRNLMIEKLIYELIVKLEPTIHAIQAPMNPCYRDMDNADIAAIAGVAYYSGGTYSVSGSGESLFALPLQHKSAFFDDNYLLTCKGNQSFQFNVDSETSSLSLRPFGDIKGEVKFLAPNRKDSLTPTKIYASYLDYLYTINSNNLKTTDKYLPAGVWLVEFEVYKDDDLPCGLRVDGQSDLQLYRLFNSSITADEGSNQATLNSINNRQIIHLESSLAQNTSQLSVDFAHFYSSNSDDLAFSTSIQPRSQCTYQFVSEQFYPTDFVYYVKYNGTDAAGNKFQRIVPLIPLDEFN